MAQIKILVKDIAGMAIKDTFAVFNLNSKGLIEGVTNTLGEISIIEKTIVLR